MQKETELTKHLLTTLFLANYELGTTPDTPIRLVDKRSFYQCELVQYKFRPVENKRDNLLLVLEFFSHQCEVTLGKTITTLIGSFPHALKLRVVKLVQTRSGTGYNYVAQLQGNTNKPIFLERT